jgi:hypothetical protein
MRRPEPRGLGTNARYPLANAVPTVSIEGHLSQFAAGFCHSGWKLHDLFRKEATMRDFASGSVDPDLVVVGGGLAGLSVAAQAGRSVTVFEQAADVGGRAATQVSEGISFNLGPHALYFS